MRFTMNTQINKTQTGGTASQYLVKDYVATNIKAANIFEKYGIDFCCKGYRPLMDVCNEKGIDPYKVLNEIDSLKNGEGEDNNRYGEWELDFLAKYIVNNHHEYVRTAIPQINAHLAKVCEKHGSKFPFLNDVNKNFQLIAAELYSHMEKEEKILFPIIKYLVDSEKFNEKPRTAGYGTIKGPVAKMESEHDEAGNVLANIKLLTNNYQVPEGACNTFKLTYDELKEFETDLHKHIHLENNILFPKAIALEEKLLRNLA